MTAAIKVFADSLWNSDSPMGSGGESGLRPSCTDDVKSPNGPHGPQTLSDGPGQCPHE